MNQLSIPTLAAIYQALKASGHWYDVYAGPWSHPLNNVANCFAIVFDGYVQCKFTVLDDDRLGLVKAVGDYYLPIQKIVPVGGIICINQLIEGIRKNPFVGQGAFNLNQDIHIDQCIRIVTKQLTVKGYASHHNKVS